MVEGTMVSILAISRKSTPVARVVVVVGGGGAGGGGDGQGREEWWHQSS